MQNCLSRCFVGINNVRKVPRLWYVKFFTCNIESDLRLKPSMICYSNVTHSFPDCFKYMKQSGFWNQSSCYISVTMGVVRTGMEAG